MFINFTPLTCHLQIVLPDGDEVCSFGAGSHCTVVQTGSSKLVYFGMVKDRMPAAGMGKIQKRKKKKKKRRDDIM